LTSEILNERLIYDAVQIIKHFMKKLNNRGKETISVEAMISLMLKRTSAAYVVCIT
jgi:hypothetical protein